MKYKCETCGTEYDFPSKYPTIYCQALDCDGLCRKMVAF